MVIFWIVLEDNPSTGNQITLRHRSHLALSEPWPNFVNSPSRHVSFFTGALFLYFCRLSPILWASAEVAWTVSSQNLNSSIFWLIDARDWNRCLCWCEDDFCHRRSNCHLRMGNNWVRDHLMHDIGITNEEVNSMDLCGWLLDYSRNRVKVRFRRILWLL